MRVGVAGPVSLQMLRKYLNLESDRLPRGYDFAPMALWIEELIKRYDHVIVYTTSPGLNERVTFKGQKLTVHVCRQGGGSTLSAVNLYKTERKDLLNAMLSNSPDIIHAHWTYEFAWSALTSGTPTLVTAHDAPLNIIKFFPPHQKVARLIRAGIAYKVSHDAKFMTAVSPYIAEHFIKKYSYNKRLVVIPNGVPRGIFEIGKTKRRSLEIDSDHVVSFAAVIVGWSGRKNGQTLLDAFSKVKKYIPKSRLLLFGSGHGPYEPAQHWAQKNNMTDGVEFVGALDYRKMLHRLVEEVDILVHPSLEESHSLAIVEAMALGIPVIAGKDSGAVPYTLDYGKAGILTDVKSAEVLAAEMVRLALDAELRSHMSEIAHASALERFSMTKAWDAYEEMYRLVLEC